jgi:hypothetical protein
VIVSLPGDTGDRLAVEPLGLFGFDWNGQCDQLAGTLQRGGRGVVGSPPFHMLAILAGVSVSGVHAPPMAPDL